MGGDRGSKGDFGRGIGETTHFARRVTDGKTIMEKTTDNGGIGDDYFFSPSPWEREKKKRGFRESVGWEEKELLVADAGEAPDRKGRGETQGNIRVLVLVVFIPQCREKKKKSQPGERTWEAWCVYYCGSSSLDQKKSRADQLGNNNEK